MERPGDEPDPVAVRGALLRRARDLRGISREQLCAITEVSVATISRIERGTATPENRSIGRLEEELAPELDRLRRAERRPDDARRDEEPRLSEATFAELLAEANKRYATLERRLGTAPHDLDDTVWFEADSPLAADGDPDGRDDDGGVQATS